MRFQFLFIMMLTIFIIGKGFLSENQEIKEELIVDIFEKDNERYLKPISLDIYLKANNKKEGRQKVIFNNVYNTYGEGYLVSSKIKDKDSTKFLYDLIFLEKLHGLDSSLKRLNNQKVDP